MEDRPLNYLAAFTAGYFACSQISPNNPSMAGLVLMGLLLWAGYLWIKGMK